MDPVSIELEAEPFQVELLGKGRVGHHRFVVEGHDLSSVTTSVDIRVPSSGPVEVTAYILPTRHTRTLLRVLPNHLRYWIEGIEALIRMARESAKAWEERGDSDSARALSEAADRVESGL